MAKHKAGKSTILGVNKTWQSNSLLQQKHFYRIIVFVFSFLLFSNSIFNDYNLDDELVTRNHHLTSKGLSGIPEIFSSPYYEDNMGYAYEYRPVVLSSFAVEHQIFGDNAQVSHFINVLLYSLTCVLLYIVLSMLLRVYPNQIAFAIALLFAAHTSHTEVVCSIKNRDEVLGLFFSLSAMFCILKSILKSKYKALTTVPIFYSLALMSKATIVSFSIIIPLAVIVFTEVSVGQILLISSLLVIPNYFFLPFSNGSQRLLIQLILLISSFLVYCLKNYAVSLAFFRKGLHNIQAQIFEKHLDNSPLSVSNNKPSSSFFSFLNQIIPGKEVLSLPPILLTVPLGLTYLTLINNSFFTWATIPMLLLVLLAWKGRKNVKWWASSVIILTLAFAFITLVYSGIIEGNNEYEKLLLTTNGNILLCALSPFLVYHVFSGKRDLFIPSAIALLAFESVDLYRYQNFESFGPIVILLLAFHPYTRFILLAWTFIQLANKFGAYNLSHLSDLLEVMLLGLIVYFKDTEKGGKYLSLWLCLIIVALLHISEINSNHKIRINNPITTTQAVMNKVNPQIISKQDRPLHFTEQCVTGADPVSIRTATSMVILLHYFKKVIIPYPLSYYYGYKFIEPVRLTETIPLFSSVVYLILILGGAYLLYKDKLTGIGVIIYLLSIIVFSDFIQYIPGMVADRYLLIPSLGWSIVVVGILRKFSGVTDNAKNVSWSSIGPMAKYPFLAILLLYSTLTFSRNFDWKDDLTLFRHDIDYVNESAQAHNLLALHLMQHFEKENSSGTKVALANEAIAHFKKAQEIYPSFFNVAYDIGRVYSAINQPDSAIMAYEYALSLNKDLPDIYLRLGDLYFSKNNFDKAAQHLKEYIKKSPSDINGYNRLSYTYYLLKQYDESIATNKRAISTLPGFVEPYINIAHVFSDLKQRDSSMFYLREGEKKFPSNPQIIQAIEVLQKNVSPSSNR
jgi:tetratricopeptide (TPR) repeat protein